VGAAIPLWLVWRNLVARVSRPLLHAMLRFSVPLVPASVAVILTQVIDRLAINAFMSLRDVGRYGIAYRIASLVSLGLSGAQLSFTPLVLANHKDATTPRAVADSLRYFVAVALTLFVFLSVFADVVLNILTPGAYHSASSVVPLLVLVVAISPLYIFAPGLVIARDMKKLAVTYIATALINTALVCALVPLFGVMGAAISTLAAFVFSNAVQFTLSQRRYPVPYPWARLSAAFGSAATAVLIDRIVFTHGLSVQELLGKSVIACLALLLIGRSLIDRGELRLIRERIPFLRPRPQPSGTT
jgi:O-antigen/teichoic acid export membrane protein